MTVSPRLLNPIRLAEPSRPSGTRWARLAVVAAILASSGGVRLWRERQVGQALEVGRTSPFPLAELPMTLGPWEGRQESMDPRIVRITGSTDLIARRYVDRRTGVGLDVVVLYGPTSEMMSHIPEVCYPSAGFAALPGAADRSIVVAGREGRQGLGPVPFRSLGFTRGEGGLADSQEVFYSLRYDGRWTTRSATPKSSRRIPGMYKVQVSRRLTSREARGVESPCEPFLAALVGEIETRLAGGVFPATN